MCVEGIEPLKVETKSRRLEIVVNIVWDIPKWDREYQQTIKVSIIGHVNCNCIYQTPKSTNSNTFHNARANH